MQTIGLLVTGALGMLGWFFAWWGQRQVVSKNAEVAAAVAGENSAKSVAVAAEGKASTSAALYAAEKARADGLQVQLDGERKARQDLVYELAKKGVPVGDAVVDAAVDRLYPDGDQGGQGPRPVPGGDPSGLSGQPAGPSGNSSGQG